jgi:hypothetical protein
MSTVMPQAELAIFATKNRCFTGYGVRNCSSMVVSGRI